MISLADARAAVLQHARRLPAERSTLLDALGLVLAEDVRATGDVPPFDTTAMDGYAVRAADTVGAGADTPITFHVHGTIFAGAATDVPVGPGEAWKIMTGAPVPPGADAIVPVEQSVAADAETVGLVASAAVGANVRPVGSNIPAGALVLGAGTVLGPVQIGVLASVGVRTVEVVRRPRVGVLVTGDELVADERPLRPGEIYESNKEMLLGLLIAAGCDPIDLGIVGDDIERLRARLADAVQRCDAIITSGGVSMGDADPVKTLLTSMARTQWMQVSIRPAKPFLLSEFDGPTGPVPLFGVPGNPVSALVSFELLVRPALAQLSGRPAERPLIPAVADAGLSNHRGDARTTYLRVTASFGADGRVHVRPVAGGQGSHQLGASAAAVALAELPPDSDVAVGADVPVLLLTPATELT